VSVMIVVVGVATCTPLRRTMYPVTPTLSEDAFQERLAAVEPAAAAVRPVTTGARPQVELAAGGDRNRVADGGIGRFALVAPVLGGYGEGEEQQTETCLHDYEIIQQDGVGIPLS